MVLAAGLDGIDDRIEPGRPRDENLYDLSTEELESQSVERLPKTLIEAIECLESSHLASEVLGEKLKRDFIRLKRTEWAEWFYQVTDWELRTYLSW
jgi:glutamine synthetase